MQTPLDLERELGLRRGNVMHVEMGLDAMFAYRPLPELAGYRTPVRGLYPHRRVDPPGRRRLRRVGTHGRAGRHEQPPALALTVPPQSRTRSYDATWASRRRPRAAAAGLPWLLARR